MKIRQLALPAGAGVFALLAAALPAAAHDGEHGALSTLAALGHLVTQPDHLMGAAALALLIGLGAVACLKRRAG